MLDVPAEAVVVDYGFYLRGSGTVCAAYFTLRKSEAVTKASVCLLPEPWNLNFSPVAIPAY